MLPERTDSSLSERSTVEVTERVLVAVRAEKVISKTALAWALTHVVRPGDGITLLALFPPKKSGRRFWRFPRLNGDCKSSHAENLPDRICEISESCSQMVLKLHNQIEVSFKIYTTFPNSSLFRKLKQELKHCLEELHCNIVVMKNSLAKVLRLNLQVSNDDQTPYLSAAASPIEQTGKLPAECLKNSTPVSSPERPISSSSRTDKQGSLTSSDTMTSLFLVYEQNPLFEGMNRGYYTPIDDQSHLDDQLMALDSPEKRLTTLSTKSTPSEATNYKSVFWIPQSHIVDKKLSKPQNYRDTHKSRRPTSRSLLDEFIQYDQDTKAGRLEYNQGQGINPSSTIRDAVPFGRTSSIPPPLCSLCQHKAPIFGKPPRRFSYEELEEATDSFSSVNFLAEGGFGVVYRGVLRDGQVVAVKLLKFGGSQADADFCREVRVLSCAQHRNVVLLIGFCTDGKRRVLVYEYICNGSLDFHLHGNKRATLDWQSRLKIAIGAARGLRYLHEDCRVGCIVHRDMRPNNILLTHDFEPQVADFGLARWHSELCINTEERVIGTSGYLAPEYADGGGITQKFDVYAFGLVLVELITGQRTSKLQCYKGQHVLSDWFHPQVALEPGLTLEKIYYLIDPYLASNQAQSFTHQLQAMARAAFLCLCPDPESRPPMSKVLRILEGGDTVVPLALDLNSVGNRSGHLPGLSSSMQHEGRRTHCRMLSHVTGTSAESVHLLHNVCQIREPLCKITKEI
ncbi:inactive protein kinase SELMODRAFT_444075-like isoform X2 [Mangifera indica]|uniref:inactive protein kinase SELMODRAFT_444075-like isoform X2 n=1 Tax=Mangifera indica TaxID=29780 RepID=UPI001CFC311E|nr:inactive protein kinase SELMODRAFT_444075-like isoform X2 [Mangifera indica]